LSEEDDSATTSEELLTAATSLEEDCTLLLDSFGVILEEDPCSLLDVNKNAYPSLLSITSSELLDVISPIGLVEDSVSPPHPTNDMHADPASRQRMIALKAEKRRKQEGRVWVVIGGSLSRLLLNIYYHWRFVKKNIYFAPFSPFCAQKIPPVKAGFSKRYVRGLMPSRACSSFS
jgi:hypothetical protein